MPPRYPLLILFSTFCISCTDEPNTLGVGNNSFAKSYGVVLIDTMTVAVSTVLLDSIPTSGTGTLLAGGYEDEKLGTLQAEGYLQLGTGETWEPSAAAVFDSLVLVAKYSGYSYGDTTTVQTFEVRRITQSFKSYSLPQYWVDERQYSALYKEGSLYNSSTIRSEAVPLGTRAVRLRPGSQDSLSIRLNDDLGREWLQLAQNKSTTISQQDKFLEYFKGIAISAASLSCVTGFTTEDVKARLYYKQYEGEEWKQQFHVFPFSSERFNYSRLSSDRTGTILENLAQHNNEVEARETSDEAFIQSGSGVVTKVHFPYVRKMIDLKDLLIVNQAQLIIEPLKNSYNEDLPLPLSLTLYQTDKSNLPLNQLYADFSTDTYQSAYISMDEEFDTSTGYIFNITQYVQKLLSTEGNLEKGLLIMPPPDEISKNVNKVYLSAGSANRVRLKVWYTQKK